MSVIDPNLFELPPDLEESYLNVTNLTEFNDFPSSLFNFPISDVYKIIYENSKNSYLGFTAQVVLITIYAVLIALGIIGNVLVAFVIGRKSELRTARNLYIINLTISDVSLCLVSMPFTLVGLLKKNWTLGSVICKLIPALQCTNILVSTATIVAIATDRYKTIVLGNRQFGTRTSVPCSVVLIWVASLGFTCPLFVFYHVETVDLRGYFLFDRCIDNWQPPIIKALWILCLLLIQYVIPILVLSFVHVKIKKFLSENQASQKDPRRMHREIERNRRTTTLLTSVALTFAVSWLPWYVVNFLADFHYSGFKEPEYFYVVFGGCHAIAMSTSCSNPILYGWLNTNLKKELSELISRVLNKIKCKSFHWRKQERPASANNHSKAPKPWTVDVTSTSIDKTNTLFVENTKQKDMSSESFLSQEICRLNENLDPKSHVAAENTVEVHMTEISSSGLVTEDSEKTHNVCETVE